MRARTWWVAVMLAVPVVAAAEPKPAPVDIKAIRDKLIVLVDASGGTYVAKPGEDPRLFFGTGKQLYEQSITGRSANGDGWGIDVFAPRVPGYQPGTIMRNEDGSYVKFCGGENKTGLTLVTGDKAKAVLDKDQFLTTAVLRLPHAFFRDDTGTYYYVDALREQYGGKGFRVFVGKKGAMKQLPLSDVASDSAGEVFSTKTGDLRLVMSGSQPKSGVWIKGGKKTELIVLDTDRDSPVIFKDLGIYGFMGTICDDI
ncbi:MAG: hypothetical protein JO257_06640 [Deltaproteobacteria bacterium]|nr:hypothetical protein [Deltaproteobacteria bacterium]